MMGYRLNETACQDITDEQRSIRLGRVRTQTSCTIWELCWPLPMHRNPPPPSPHPFQLGGGAPYIQRLPAFTISVTYKI